MAILEHGLGPSYKSFSSSMPCFADRCPHSRAGGGGRGGGGDLCCVPGANHAWQSCAVCAAMNALALWLRQGRIICAQAAAQIDRILPRWPKIRLSRLHDYVVCTSTPGTGRAIIGSVDARRAQKIGPSVSLDVTYEKTDSICTSSRRGCCAT